MKLRLVLLAYFSFLILVAVSKADVMGILIPAYGNPTFMDDSPVMWSSLVATAQDPDRRFPIRAIINPLNGPGPIADQVGYREDYFGTMNDGPAAQFRTAGGQTFGYVSTDRGNRDRSLVEGDIHAYLGGTYKGLFDGIFLDEFYDEQSDLDYYEQVYDFVNDNYEGTLIIGNVGDVGDVNVLNSEQATNLIGPLSTLVSHEMPLTLPEPFFSSYLDMFTPLAHNDLFSESKFAHLVHDAGTVWDPAISDLADKRGTGWFYATPDSGGNPWDNFDLDFWTAFTASINQINAAVLGDVNEDSVVNLLDVGPFVDLLVNGGFSENADINCDGEVNLLDVQPFVQLISG